MFKNVASQKVQLFAFDITTGAAKTGDAANLTAYVSKDHGAVTVLTDTSATEMDATNAKGVYVFDLAQAETNADELTFSAKSTTANISIVARFVSTNPPSFTAFVTPTGATVAAVTGAVGSVTGSVGSVTGAVGSVTGLTASDVGAIKTKTDFLPSATAGAAGGVFIAGANAATSITTALTANIIGNVTGNLSGSVGSVTGAVGSVTGAVGSVAAGGIAAASFAAGAITATVIATDAIDADALATDAVTEIQSGLSTLTAAGVRTAVGLASANLDTQLTTIDDFLDTEVAAIKVVTDKLNSTVVSVGSPGDYVFTAPALALAPSGTGASAVAIADEVQLRTIAGVTLVATVTNLTNAATNGDLTATMKTSVTTAATASTPALSTAGNAAVADKLLGRNIAGGSDGGRTVQDALRPLRNKTTIAGGTMTVCIEDDTTTAWTAAVTTTPGDPLSAIDPA